MAKNCNSVNIESSGERYHHGDLRAALVEEGLRLLKGGPAEAVSLREMARNVGVSATAVYRHFPDKAALLEALCEVGDAQMADAFTLAMANAKPGREAFGAMGGAYVRFALANPSLFRLMMSTNPTRGDAHESRGRALLVAQIEKQAGGKASQAVRDVQQLRAWSMVHGLAMLMLDGQVPPDDALIDQVVEAELGLG